MPIYVKALDNKGAFIGGFAQGYCEYFDTTKDIVMKGHFKMNKLVGSDNSLIEYTDTTFRYFYGMFANNQPNGNIIIYEFVGNGDLLQDIVSIITVQKKNCIYDAGILVSTISSQATTVKVKIVYKQIVGSEFMTQFDLKEA